MSFNAKISSHDGSKKRIFRCTVDSFIEFKSTGCEKLGLCSEDIRIVTDEDFEVDDLDSVRDMCQSTVFYFLQQSEKLITLNAPAVAVPDLGQAKVISTSTTAKENVLTPQTLDRISGSIEQASHSPSLRQIGTQFTNVALHGPVISRVDPIQSENALSCVASDNPSLGFKICAPTMPNPDPIKEETVDYPENFPGDSSPSSSRGVRSRVSIFDIFPMDELETAEAVDEEDIAANCVGRGKRLHSLSGCLANGQPPSKKRKEASTTISEEDGASSQNSIMAILGKMCKEMHFMRQDIAHLKMMICPQYDIDQVRGEAVSMLRLDSLDRFDEMEMLLNKSPEEQQILSSYLSLAGGSTCQEVSIRMLRRFMTDNLAIQFNVEGGGIQKKRALKGTRTLMVLTAAIRKNPPTKQASDRDIERSCATYLKRAIDRVRHRP